MKRAQFWDQAPFGGLNYQYNITLGLIFKKFLNDRTFDVATKEDDHFLIFNVSHDDIILLSYISRFQEIGLTAELTETEIPNRQGESGNAIKLKGKEHDIRHALRPSISAPTKVSIENDEQTRDEKSSLWSCFCS